MACGAFRRAKRTKSNRTKSGQGLVEFALVGGLFFFLLFSIINAGFFLYGRNAVQHAADVGVAAIAAEGDCVAVPVKCPTPPTTTGDADQVGISRMGAAGLTTTPLTTVTEIDVWHEIQQSSGVFVDDMTCSAGGGSGTGSIACQNRYDVNGNVLNSGALPWPPAKRGVCGTCSAGADFAKLVITFKYQMLVGNTTFTLTTNNVFRLEPQT
jgi:hypothetical protein